MNKSSQGNIVCILMQMLRKVDTFSFLVVLFKLKLKNYIT